MEQGEPLYTLCLRARPEVNQKKRRILEKSTDIKAVCA